jgi:hypothetical protein
MDCWLLNGQRQIFHTYSRQEQVHVALVQKRCRNRITQKGATGKVWIVGKAQHTYLKYLTLRHSTLTNPSPLEEVPSSHIGY